MLRESHVYPPQKGLYTHLCALGPILPPGWTASPRAKGLLVVGSEASAGSARGPLKFHCRDAGAHPMQTAPLHPLRSSQPGPRPLCPKPEPLAWSWARLETPWMVPRMLALLWGSALSQPCCSPCGRGCLLWAESPSAHEGSDQKLLDASALPARAPATNSQGPPRHTPAPVCVVGARIVGAGAGGNLLTHGASWPLQARGISCRRPQPAPRGSVAPMMRFSGRFPIWALLPASLGQSHSPPVLKWGN